MLCFRRAISYYVEPADTVRILGCVGRRNGAKGAKVAYEAIGRTIPINPYPPLPIFVGAELAFTFIYDSSYRRVSNVGSSCIIVSFFYSK